MIASDANVKFPSKVNVWPTATEIGRVDEATTATSVTTQTPNALHEHVVLKGQLDEAAVVCNLDVEGAIVKVGAIVEGGTVVLVVVTGVVVVADVTAIVVSVCVVIVVV